LNDPSASAGTLITLAADKLIISDHAELGPLDVQVRKPDEVGERTSGLTPIQALQFLEGESLKFFRSQFLGLRFGRSLSFSTKMAADIAAQLSTGLLSQLYEQIDPLRLAEYDRMMRIAADYGERIKTSNVKPHAIDQLLIGYPSHEFSIDATEAKELFVKVQPPSDDLEELGEAFGSLAAKYLYLDDAAVFYLNSKPEHEAQKYEQARQGEGPTNRVPSDREDGTKDEITEKGESPRDGRTKSKIGNPET
jgi:Serine dehydrogenase proteinase